MTYWSSAGDGWSSEVDDEEEDRQICNYRQGAGEVSCAILDPASLLLATLATTVLTGWLANRSITDHPLLEILREET